VTDSIADIGPALHSLSKRVKLVCIYGGDGTIQKILTEIFRTLGDDNPPVALIGGGTMNVTARWSGWTESPEANFREAVRAYQTEKLLTREVPLLSIQQGARVEYGFTFGAGTPIRVLAEYERGSKGKLGALRIAARSISAIWSGAPVDVAPTLEQMTADIAVDGIPLPYNKYTALFCNITGQVNRLVRPFAVERQRDTFLMLAYTATPRELSTLLPFLLRGMLPIDAKSMIKPLSTWTQIGLSYFGKGSLPLDPRYVNRTASELELRTQEQVYTIDGEIFESTGEPFTVRLGPTLRLAMNG